MARTDPDGNDSAPCRLPSVRSDYYGGECTFKCIEVGGGANYSNDLQVDGSPIGIGYKTSYMPSPDSVEEVAVQQNAVDAEYGHSSGSAITLTMKAGTNEWHGNTFYQGQYPWANALENRVFRTINLGRTQMWGGTLGNPIK
mgnify:CR=1 FL=1